MGGQQTAGWTLVRSGNRSCTRPDHWDSLSLVKPKLRAAKCGMGGELGLVETVGVDLAAGPLSSQ